LRGDVAVTHCSDSDPDGVDPGMIGERIRLVLNEVDACSEK